MAGAERHFSCTCSLPQRCEVSPGPEQPHFLGNSVPCFEHARHPGCLGGHRLLDRGQVWQQRRDDWSPFRSSESGASICPARSAPWLMVGFADLVTPKGGPLKSPRPRGRARALGPPHSGSVFTGSSDIPNEELIRFPRSGTRARAPREGGWGTAVIAGALAKVANFPPIKAPSPPPDRANS